jgi:hypothetical protein
MMEHSANKTSELPGDNAFKLYPIVFGSETTPKEFVEELKKFSEMHSQHNKDNIDYSASS